MSLYIQITNRCNMTCSHCCFACTAKGSDMSVEDFHRAIRMAKEYEQHVTIGGGEPTLHPRFREFLMHAVWELTHIGLSSGFPAVHMVTNGSNTEMALTIAALAEMGTITAAVSRDQYHDPIDERVYQAFEKPKREGYHREDHDHRSVNKEGIFIIPAGRAKGWGNHPYNRCVCDSLFITPKGNVFPCGCKKTKIGHVSGDFELKYEMFEGLCEKSKEYKQQVLEAV